MGFQLLSSFLFLGVVIVSCFGELSLSNTFLDDNSIKLVSNDGLRDEQHSTYSIIDDDHDLDDFSNGRIGRHCIKAIYQFGDSISDTGNFIWEDPYSSFGQFPYGETYFQKPTGRCSDGRLMIDYLAKFLKLPFLEPYLNKEGNFEHGANFAVIGATALDVSTLVAKDIIPSVTNHSLSVQLGWFKSHINSIYSDTSECKRKLAKALFIVGEIGGNDYNFAISVGKQPPFLYQMVPEVVQAISNVTEELISLGATQLIIPGNFPVGCMTVYLAGFKSNDPSMYDDLKCLISLNEFAKFHNDQLRQTIKKLRKKHPHVAIAYMDLDKAMRKMLQHATSLGFKKKVMYKACCGSGDDDNYNFNSSAICGIPGVRACQSPQKHVSWDGFHLTDRAYQVMTTWLISHIFDGTSTFS
ncbi:hypothetical protein RND81_08G026600 [Saponaria officinalis]|uniref:Uncharacterized protein n=1 Tax=Saponaria officinalis TaxID=3572 RepID=A0AAW1J1T9_SAPOF